MFFGKFKTNQKDYFMKKFVSNNPEESKKFAQNFVKEVLTAPMSRRNLDIGAVVLALMGDLGSGKTAFAQAFAEALGVREKIKSPTFIIFRKHEIPARSDRAQLWRARQKSKFRRLYHFDVYRIHSEKEILNLGWEEIIKNQANIVLVEWADKIEKILPKNCVKIMFKHLKGDGREITIS